MGMRHVVEPITNISEAAEKKVRPQRRDARLITAWISCLVCRKWYGPQNSTYKDVITSWQHSTTARTADKVVQTPSFLQYHRP